MKNAGFSCRTFFERFATELRGRGFDAIAPENGDVVNFS